MKYSVEFNFPTMDLKLIRKKAASLFYEVYYYRNPLISFLSHLGFLNYYRSVVHGPKDRLHLSRPLHKYALNVFNTLSGHIYIGEGTITSQNCMFLTGRHQFEKSKLKQPKSQQVPSEGFDIRIGSGCWIASNAIIIGRVTIGDNCLVAAGSVVTKNFPDNCILAGVPAKIVGSTSDRVK